MDTTGTTAGFILYGLAKHPDALNKVMDEIKTFPDLSYENLNQMHYITAVIKETLRMWPAVACIVPRISTKDTYLGEILVPKGTEIVPLLIVAQNSNHFTNPDKFIPERWLEKLNHHTYSYIPFSAGKRNCIG